MVMDELNSSELGTKEYWNEAYKKELHNFYDVNDFGHEWFGRSAKTRVVRHTKVDFFYHRSTTTICQS